MSIEPSIPDYKRSLIENLEELKKEFSWCIKHPQKVSTEKINDFKRGVRNLKYFAQDKIIDENFNRDLDRFEVLIKKLPNMISDIEKSTVEMIFERIEKLIHDVG
ncbi:MAG: hypothetical protein WCT85_04965 [Parachlamydiales bacterium]|jgi:hypothetical protein